MFPPVSVSSDLRFQKHSTYIDPCHTATTLPISQPAISTCELCEGMKCRAVGQISRQGEAGPGRSPHEQSFGVLSAGGTDNDSTRACGHEYKSLQKSIEILSLYVVDNMVHHSGASRM